MDNVLPLPIYMESVTTARLLLTVAVFCVVCATLEQTNCPVQCECDFTDCDANNSFCEGASRKWGVSVCEAFTEDVIRNLPNGTNSVEFLATVNLTKLISLVHRLPKLAILTIPLTEDVLSRHVVNGTVEISYLNLSYGVLQSFPSFVTEVEGLEKLNLSNNAIQGSLDLHATFEDLEVLDLSDNALSGFSHRNGFPKLRSMLLRNNQLHMLPVFKNVPLLRELDISDNFFVLSDTLNEHNYDDKSSRIQSCAIHLPSRITSLYLRSNLFWRIPSQMCGPLAGLTHLKHLYLENNAIHSIGDNDFSSELSRTLMSLRLDGNRIRYISPNAFNNFGRLKLLSLTNNLLQHIPIQILSHIGKKLEYNNPLPQEYALQVSGNPYSCDCTQVEFLEFLTSLLQNTSGVMSKYDIECYYPLWMDGSRLVGLAPSELECFDAVLERTKNVTCNQYDDCALDCVFDGLPYPMVHWTSPAGKEISDETLGSDPSLRATYSLSENGHKLTIMDLQYHKTGIYKCTGNNENNSSLSGVVRVGVVLTPVGSIVAIVVSAVSFLVAIVLNSVNLFHYYCHHLSDKRKRREEEAMSFKMESPIKSKRKGLHESEASLNANKYYRKYDFTCQQVFLDTVIKGAHTVKRTLYDAKNSGFSNNVWEYAAHLRDRLHIELPSSMQFPRVSMPSISMPSISMPSISMPSMPNISMPSMPNFQSINTNIEKLGTSVMHRSHNLATSVGSVFTLRWLRSGNSDNESDSDGEEAGVAQVQVHVHKHNDAMSSQELQSSGENLPGLLSGPSGESTIVADIPSKVICHDDSPNSDGACTTRRAKSVRFSEGNRPSIGSKLRRSASFNALTKDATSRSSGDEISPVSDDTCQSVTVSIASMGDTYQYETTV